MDADEACALRFDCDLLADPASRFAAIGLGSGLQGAARSSAATCGVEDMKDTATAAVLRKPGFLGSIAHRVRIWWVAASVGFFWITFNYVYLPQSLNFAANEWAQSIGIDLHTEGWSVNWIEQKISASGLTIRVPGEIEPIVEVPELALEFSLLRLMDGWRGAIYQLSLHRPVFRLYKPLGGEWNLFGVLDSRRIAALIGDGQPPDASVGGAQMVPVGNPVSFSAHSLVQAVVRLDWVLIDGLTVHWREEMPGDSDGTTTLTRFADIRLQDGQLRARDVHWPVTDAGRIQSFEFEANVGAGRVRVSSAGNLTSWRPPTPGEPEWRLQPLVWDPTLRGRLTLQQFSAETVSRLMPSPELIAASGVMNGSVDFEVFDRSFLRVRAPDLQLEGVEYVQLDTQQRYAAGTTANSSFEGNLRDARFRPAALYAATVTESSLQDQPDDVRVSAVQQTMQLEEGVSERSRNELQQQRPPAVRALVSGLAGEVVANQLADELGTQGARAAGAVAEGLIDAAPANGEEGGTEGQPNVLKRVGSKIGTTTRSVWRKITGKGED